MSSEPTNPYADEEHGYIIATYILAPTLFLVGLMVMMYVCCNKKYKLNWFERTLLEQGGSAEEEGSVNEGSHLTRGEKEGSSRQILGCVDGEEGGEEGEEEEEEGEEGRYLLEYSYQQARQSDPYQTEYRDNRQGVPPPPQQKYKSGVVSARVTPISPLGDALTCCSASSQHAARHWYPSDRQGPPPQQSRDLLRDPQPRSGSQKVRAHHAEPEEGRSRVEKGARGGHSLRHGQKVPGCEDALTGSGDRAAPSRSAQGNVLIGGTPASVSLRQAQEEKQQQLESQRWSQNLGLARNHAGNSSNTTTTATTTTSSYSSSAAASFFSFFSSSPSPRPSPSPEHPPIAAAPRDNQGNHYTTTTTTTTTSSPWHHSSSPHHHNLPPPPPQQPGKYALLVSDTSPCSTSAATSMGSLSSTHSAGADPGGGSVTGGSAPSSRLSPRNSLTPSLGGGTGEQFWVPPAVLQKKRAQSLIPSLLHHPDSDESSSPSRTPTTSTSLQEMAFSFPPERLTETVSMVQAPAAPGPGAAHRSRRRASMQDALDATMINTSLYDSIAVPQPPQEFGSIQEEQLGSIHFSLDYNPEQGLLTVRLIQARDLVPRDFSGTADPYCRLCLLPQRRPQLQSKLQKKTTSPEFGEDFIFEVMSDDIDSRTLEILVYDYDQYSRDEPIGEVCLPLEEVDLSETVALWKGISQPTKQAVVDESLGDLMVSMSYLASAERLTISVLKARYLQPPEDGKTTSNPFVKVQVILGTKRLKKKKTSTKKNTLNPTWNEALVFNLSKELLPRVTLEFFVCSDNLLGSNETLGKMSLGPDSTGEELVHWKDMIAVRSSNAMYHKLLPPPQESPVYQNLGRRCSDFS